MFSAYRLARRERSLRLCVEFIDAVSVELNYSMEPLEEMLEYFCASGRFEQLLFPKRCLELMRGTEPFPSAFGRAVNESAPALAFDGGDCELVSSIGGILGASDADGQLRALAGKREELTSRTKDAREKSVTLGRLYRALGLLAGAGAVVLIL